MDNAQQLTIDDAIAQVVENIAKTPEILSIYASWDKPTVSIGKDFKKAVREALKRSDVSGKAEGFSQFLHVYFKDCDVESYLFQRGKYVPPKNYKHKLPIEQVVKEVNYGLKNT